MRSAPAVLVLAPELAVAVTTAVVCGLAACRRASRRPPSPALLAAAAVTGCAVALALDLVVVLGLGARSALAGVVALDGYAASWIALVLVAAVALLGLWAGGGHRVAAERIAVGLLAAAGGLCLAVAARELVLVGVAIAVAASGARAAAIGTDAPGPEGRCESRARRIVAATGAVGVLVVGVTAGSTRLAHVLASSLVNRTSVGEDLGMFLVVAALAASAGLLPWSRAPRSVGALAALSGAGVIAALMVVVSEGFFARPGAWKPLLWVLVAGSIVAGCRRACRWRGPSTALAGAGIAQLGFLAAPIVVLADGRVAPMARQAVVVEGVCLVVATLGAFAALAACAGAGRAPVAPDGASLAGLSSRAPLLAIVFSACVGSLAALPPGAGWYGRFTVLRAVLAQPSPANVVLAVVVAGGSVALLAVYGAMLRDVWLAARPPGVPDGPEAARSSLAFAVAVVAAALVVVLGILPQLLGRLGQVARL